MKKTTTALVLLAVVAISFVAGLAVATWTTTRFWLGNLENEVSGSLVSAIDSLVTLRDGEAEGALELLELRAAAAILTLPQGRDWEDIPTGTRNALLVGKKYFAVYGSSNPAKELDLALAEIPDESVDPESCSPTVRRLFSTGPS